LSSGYRTTSTGAAEARLAAASQRARKCPGLSRLYSIAAQKITSDGEGHLTTLHAVRVETVRTGKGLAFEPVAGSGFELAADLMLFASPTAAYQLQHEDGGSLSCRPPW